MSTITNALDTGNYKDAMVFIGGYFNDQYVYSSKFGENSGIVLFESVTLHKNETRSSNSDPLNRLDKSYSGFIYNIKNDYKAKAASDKNKTMLKVTDYNAKVTDVALLDVDTDQDGKFDSISSLYDRGFIFLDITIEKAESIKSLQFLDCDGAVYKEFDLSSANLKFATSFYNDVNGFVTEYNANNSSDKLVELNNAIVSNPHYIYSTYGSANSSITVKAVLIILAYFVVVYLIGDTALGHRYVYRGCKFVICKIFKIKPKENPKEKYIMDYYSQVTVTLDISNLSEKELEDFPEEVNFKYNNETDTLEFNLKKEEQYKATFRAKAGTYTNMRTNISEYKLVGATSNFVVSGFKTNLLILVRSNEVIKSGKI